MAKRKPPNSITFEFENFTVAQDFACWVNESLMVTAGPPTVDYDVVAQRDAYTARKPDGPLAAVLARFYTCRVTVKYDAMATVHDRKSVATLATNRGGRKVK